MTAPDVKARERSDGGQDRATETPSRLRVGILGATGAVGQKFIRLLSGHPWFRVTALVASERSRGMAFGDAVHWLEPVPLPTWAGSMPVVEPSADLPCDFVFSAMDSSAAGSVEPRMVDAGIPVLSNARNFRMDPGVPLLVPEVNPGHLGLLEGRKPGSGFLATNPNCSTTGLVMALKPLLDAFPLDRVLVTSLQAVSGAGYPGVPSMDILGNVLPEIPGEEDKLESEPLRILGTVENSAVLEARLAISAQCNRVPVPDGHLLSVSVGFRDPVAPEEVRQVLAGFRSPLGELDLPSAPRRPLRVFDEEGFPQPRLHAELEKGMGVAVGRIRRCPVLHARFVALVHNTVRGAAGGSILNAELLKARGFLPSRV